MAKRKENGWNVKVRSEWWENKVVPQNNNDNKNKNKTRGCESEWVSKRDYGKRKAITIHCGGLYLKSHFRFLFPLKLKFSFCFFLSFCCCWMLAAVVCFCITKQLFTVRMCAYHCFWQRLFCSVCSPRTLSLASLSLCVTAVNDAATATSATATAAVAAAILTEQYYK